jgi:hypothetical protein
LRLLDHCVRARIESGWQFMLMIDAPASVLIVALIYNFNHPLILFGVVGTTWWYLLSRAAEMVIDRIRKWARDG